MKGKFRNSYFGITFYKNMMMAMIIINVIIIIIIITIVIVVEVVVVVDNLPIFYTYNRS